MPAFRNPLGASAFALAVTAFVSLAVACPDRDSDAVSNPPPTATAQDPIAMDGPPPLADVFDGWTARPSADAGLQVGRNFATLISMKHVAFGTNWKWAGPKVQEAPPVGGVHSFALQTELPITGKARAQQVSPRELKLHVEYDAQRAVSGVSGIGMHFDIDLRSDVWPESPVKPTLLPDNGGFSIAVADREALEVTYEGPGRVFFERKDPKQVRILMLRGNVAAGHYESTITVRLPLGGQVMPSVTERYGSPSTDGWAPSTVVWNDWPVDVAFLSDGDRPAGKHGRVRADGDRLVFEDGTPARFWGTNVAARSLFVGSRADVEQQAKRLNALGFNLVRLHHHDAPWIPNNVFDPAAGTTQRLDADALQRLDWWIKSLTQQGIYVWIDLHVGRRFVAGDGIDGFDELMRAQKGEGKGFNYVNDRIEALMQRFAEQYLGHKNEFTGKTWAADPAVLAVLVTNENDLGDHFGGLMLPDKGNRVHQALFEKQAREIIADRGLPPDKAMRTWEPGPGKILLAELQHRFDARAMKHVRGLGSRALLSTTSYWGRNNLWTLPAISSGDVVDVHSYGEEEALGVNPHDASNWIHFIATAQLTGKPLTVTEWNVPPPARDRFTAPLYAASIGGLQSWDALMLYAYNQGPIEPPRGTNKWSAWIDPALIALGPAAAIMFRRGDASPAKDTYVVRATSKDVFGKRRNAETSAALRTLPERSRLVLQLPTDPALPWLAPSPGPEGAIEVEDLDRDFLEGHPQQVVSDTGELRRDWAAGVQTIDTPRSQAVSGWVGDRSLRTSDAGFDLVTPKATAAFTSLDGAPLPKSKRVLLTVVARATPGPQNQHWLAEPVRGSVRLRTELDDMVMIPLLPTDRAKDAPSGRTAITGKRRGDRVEFALPEHPITHWFLVVPKR